MSTTLKSLKFLAVSTAMLILLFGCQKGNPLSQALSAGKCEIKATVSGAVSSNYSSDALGSNAIKNSMLMNLASSTVSLPTSQFVIILPANVATGTYPFKTQQGATGFAVSYVHQNGSGSWATGSGGDENFTLTITKSSSSEIEGVFNGTMKNDQKNSTITISNGSFKAKF
ncbi:MAG TPA: hypothetical protein PK191_08685 [Niabella sp.]|nr:hypothetical protein [Niabella sp.]HOZ98110.1 hypothetical protein [Niabella sp.]HQW16146.1 hypothetical protein [Niabella sp.]HQX21358.1 hypothetical protein [Niabella sp.]HRB08141.1 hypothetical protein [Niabella sp.]